MITLIPFDPIDYREAPFPKGAVADTCVTRLRVAILYLNTELFQRRDRHIDIRLALHGRQDMDLAVAVEQGQCEQQPRNKLGADIARYLIDAALQSSLHSKMIACFFKADALIAGDLLIHIHRTGH